MENEDKLRMDTKGPKAIYKLQESSYSYKVSEITNFVFGGQSSRFMIYRKHINSMPIGNLDNLPFYSWQCITLYFRDGNQVNLVIKD